MTAMFGSLANDFDTMTRQEMVEYMRQIRPDVAHYDIVGAHHHIMLDQPHAFASACAAQMEMWRAQKIFT